GREPRLSPSARTVALHVLADGDEPARLERSSGPTHSSAACWGHGFLGGGRSVVGGPHPPAAGAIPKPRRPGRWARERRPERVQQVRGPGRGSRLPLSPP